MTWIALGGSLFAIEILVLWKARSLPPAHCRVCGVRLRGQAWSRVLGDTACLRHSEPLR